MSRSGYIDDYDGDSWSPTDDKRWLVTVGAPHPGQDGFRWATTVVGTLEQAQKVAGEKADGHPVWVRDVMQGAVFHKLAGGVWWEGAEL